MRRLILLSTLLTVALVPLAAQSTAGWKVRPDRSTKASDPDGAGEVQFVAMGNGFHAVNSAAAVLSGTRVHHQLEVTITDLGVTT
jgi:hypothetical protein